MILNIPDQKLIAIFLKNIGMSEYDIHNFIENHRGNLMDLILTKVFNKYAENSSKEEIKLLEEKMHSVATTGSMEDQHLVLSVIQQTMENHPELAEEVREQQSLINSKLFFMLMEKANEKGQVEALEYLLEALKQTVVTTE